MNDSMDHQGVGLIARDRAGTRFFVQQKDAAYPRYPRGYSCFGGAIEAGELPEQALARELTEELGPATAALLIPSASLVGDYRVITDTSAHPGTDIGFRFWLFEAVVDSSTLDRLAAAPVLEGERGLLVDAAELLALPFIWGLEQVIDDYLVRLRGPAA